MIVLVVHNHHQRQTLQHKPCSWEAVTLKVDESQEFTALTLHNNTIFSIGKQTIYSEIRTSTMRHEKHDKRFILCMNTPWLLGFVQ